MRWINKIIPHISIGMGIGVVVLLILNECNPMMAFMTSAASKVYIILFVIFSYWTARMEIQE